MERGEFKTRSGMEIDLNYLTDNGEQVMFQPFYVQKTESLAEVLAAGKVDGDEELIANELENGAIIALLKKQMAYHHTAQGEHEGEAWAVWF